MLKAIQNIIKNINCPLTKDERRLLHKIRNCKVSGRVFTYYKTQLRNNENTTYEDARAKLIRNFILGEATPISKDKAHRLLRYFGNLSIVYNSEENEIVWLDNKVGYYPYSVDQSKKKWLNRELGINTYKVERVG